MAFPWAAVVGGVASLFGGRSRNRAASAQSQRQMDFQERMSNTAHQREVKDLRAAGLNPILSATGGRGASSPGGSAAPQQDILSPAASSALQVARTKAEIKNLKATNHLIQKQTIKIIEEANESNDRQGQIRAQTGIIRDQAKGAAIEGRIDSGKIGEYTRIFNRILGSGNSAKQLIKTGRGR